MPNGQQDSTGSDGPPGPEVGGPGFVLGRDYTVETDGRVVFTATYLLSRGKCCGSACRNCPYGWENVPPYRRPR